jgi:hypothetical protein
MTRIVLTLSDQEMAALKKRAADEMRGLKEQARYLLHLSLIEREVANPHHREPQYMATPLLAVEGGAGQ